MNIEIFIYLKRNNLNTNIVKSFGVTKKRELSENVFWDNQIQNTIEVYSETELTDKQAKTLKEWVVF